MNRKGKIGLNMTTILQFVAAIGVLFSLCHTSYVESASAAPEEPDAVIDRIRQRMEFGNIAVDVPVSMDVGNTAVIQLKLGLTIEIDDLKQQLIEAAGNQEGARVSVSDLMEAHLSGPNFAVTAISPKTQDVSRNVLTEWKWTVKPTAAGRQPLHLTLSALMSVNGESTPRAIRILDRVIEVEVS